MKYIFLLILFLIETTFVWSQNILINEFSSLNVDLIDADNDTPDWFELINVGSVDVNINEFGISDDATNLGKWLFPDMILAPNDVVMVFASGKDIREQIYYNTIIDWGDEFSYSIGVDTIPENWKQVDYNASNWPLGDSGFGFGDSDDATIIESATLSLFVRKTFEITNLNSVKEMLLHVDYDDGFVAYINGIEIARANLGTPNTKVPYNQTADTYIEPLIVNGMAPEKFQVNNLSNILIEGTNVLSIQIHNQSAGSSDLTLIPFLTIGYNLAGSDFHIADILSLNNKTLHTNFKISADGEKLFLTNAERVIIDKTDSIALPPGISFGRKINELETWLYYAEPTPGIINSTKGYLNLSEGSVTFSHVGGKYNSSISVSLSNTLGEDIYYTLDGSVPSENSLVYHSPLSINKTTVVRAMVLNSNTLSIIPSVETFIIESRATNLPIFSLSTDPMNLFDWNTGIFEMGPNAESNNPYFGANFWMDWEKPVQIEYFNREGVKVFSSPGGTKIFGGWSRANDQKSMALFARKAYGKNKFDYSFFAERNHNDYKSLVLRNSGNDWATTAFRDAMMTGLVRNLDIDRQAYQPAIVYINGSYWGLLNLREKVNENFLENNHAGVDANKVDILQNNGEIVEGTNEHYYNMLNFINANNIKDKAIYDSVNNLMDVENFLEYQIANIYFDNQDWPGNNIKFWRPQTELGKWRWIMYDTDFGFGIWDNNAYTNNTLEFALEPNGPGWPNPEWSTFLLRKLLENEDVKKDFINRFADRLNNEFKSATVQYFIDSLKSNIENEIAYHHQRWQHLWNFDSKVEVMKSFGNFRPQFMRDYISNYFSLNGTATLTVDVSDIDMGSVCVNTLTLNEFPWSGKYFKKNAIKVSAIAKPGYEFSYWEGSDSKEPEIILTVSKATKLKAVFEETEKEYGAIVINEINYSSSDETDSGDWIELYNTTNADIDLTGYKLSDSDNNRYEFKSGMVIKKRNYVVICKNLDKFSNVYSTMSNVYDNLGFGLGSEYDILRLFTAENLLVDSVFYLSERPWPVINSNQTIGLTTPKSDNALGQNWSASVGWGTPGTHNDYFSKIEKDVQSKERTLASCFPNPAAESTTIRWTIQSNKHVSINVFNSQGELVHQLFDNNCTKGTFEETWKPDSKIKSGLYFAQINFSGETIQTLKVVIID